MDACVFICMYLHKVIIKFLVYDSPSVKCIFIDLSHPWTRGVSENVFLALMKFLATASNVIGSNRIPALSIVTIGKKAEVNSLANCFQEILHRSSSSNLEMFIISLKGRKIIYSLKTYINNLYYFAFFEKEDLLH